jgi:hypothetical protein
MKNTKKRDPNRYSVHGMSEANLKLKIKELSDAGVGPLAIAVRLKMSARRVSKIVNAIKPNEDYVHQCWGLNDQFF